MRKCTALHSQCQKLGKKFTGPMFKLLLRFTVISNVYRSCMPNKTTSAKYCLTQWISKLPGSFEIHWVRQYLVNFMGLLDIANAKDRAWQFVLNFNTAFTYVSADSPIRYWNICSCSDDLVQVPYIKGKQNIIHDAIMALTLLMIHPTWDTDIM